MTERAAFFALASLPDRKRVYQVLAETRSARATWSRLGTKGSDPEAMLRAGESARHRVVTPADPEYPTGLKHLSEVSLESPLTLYLRGNALPRCHSVAVVGSRNATPYGLSVAEGLSRDMAQAGLSVISGLARGIDAAAHRGALRVASSCPVAVLGCGLDYNYPVENRTLRGRLEQQGTIVSEYPGLEPPLAWRFPARNRIIAALCEKVIIVEATRRSGALITAELASRLGRDILVVPGDVRQPNSDGILELLRDGATPVGNAQHVLEAFGINHEAPIVAPLDPVGEGILSHLSPRGTPLDALVSMTHLTIPQLLAALGQLQMQGRVNRVGALFMPV